jgi:ATP-dependent exoDNAse (exonuclease V) alpha subunit
LIYTGLTRAKQKLTLYTDPALLAQAIRRRTERHSGLSLRFFQVLRGSVGKGKLTDRDRVNW